MSDYHKYSSQYQSLDIRISLNPSNNETLVSIDEESSLKEINNDKGFLLSNKLSTVYRCISITSRVDCRDEAIKEGLFCLSNHLHEKLKNIQQELNCLANVKLLDRTTRVSELKIKNNFSIDVEGVEQ